LGLGPTPTPTPNPIKLYIINRNKLNNYKIFL